MLQLSTNRYGNASRNSIYILCGRLYVRMFVMRCSYCRVDCIRTNCGDLNAVGPTNSSAILEHPSDIIVAIAANKSPRRSSFRSSRDATPDAIVPTNTNVYLCFYLLDLFGKRKADWPIRWSEVQYICAQGAYTSIRCIDGKLTEIMAVSASSPDRIANCIRFSATNLSAANWSTLTTRIECSIDGPFVVQEKRMVDVADLF